jgi:hypothetical protein
MMRATTALAVADEAAPEVAKRGQSWANTPDLLGEVPPPTPS